MNIMHGCYAVGALLCPFLIAGALKTGAGPQIFLSACGFLLWAAFARVPVAEEKRERAKGLVFFKKREVLASHRSSFLSERHGDQRDRLACDLF